jgi:hypothetical protein
LICVCFGYASEASDRVITSVWPNIQIIIVNQNAKRLIIIQSNLIDQTWFYHHHWHLPDLRPPTFDTTIDPTWHEFENVACTSQPADMAVTLVGFMDLLG